MAPQLAELFFPGQRPEQFDLGLFALGNVDAEAQDVRLGLISMISAETSKVPTLPPRV